MNSKELEDRLPAIKNAILTIQAGNMGLKSSSHLGQPTINHDQVHDQVIQSEKDSMLLPHERVGYDFSWLQSTREQENTSSQNVKDVEDEESFLYGNDSQIQPSTSIPLAQQSQSMAQSTTYQFKTETSNAGESCYQNQPLFSNLGELLGDLKPRGKVTASMPTVRPEQTAQSLNSSHTLDVRECEKIKSMLKSLGLNIGVSDISKMMSKWQGEKEAKLPSPALPVGQRQQKQEVKMALPALGTPDVQQALVSLQSLIKATKEKRARSDPHGHSQSTVDIKQENKEGKMRTSEALRKRKEELVKELEGLLKDDGSGFLIPVIGFYCQKCEEFLGDLNTADSHAASHHRNDPITKHGDRRPGEDKEHPHHQIKHSHPCERRDERDERIPRDQRDHRHPDPKRKLDEDPWCYRNGREKVYVKEEKPASPKLLMTMLGHTPHSSLKTRERDSEGRVDKCSTSSGLASGKHRTVIEEEGHKGKHFKEDGEKNNKTKDSDNDSDGISEGEKGKLPKGSKKKKKKKEKKKEKKKKKKEKLGKT